VPQRIKSSLNLLTRSRRRGISRDVGDGTATAVNAPAISCRNNRSLLRRSDVLRSPDRRTRRLRRRDHLTVDPRRHRRAGEPEPERHDLGSYARSGNPGHHGRDNAQAAWRGPARNWVGLDGHAAGVVDLRERCGIGGKVLIDGSARPFVMTVVVSDENAAD
jgi:hypothetical protein